MEGAELPLTGLSGSGYRMHFNGSATSSHPQLLGTLEDRGFESHHPDQNTQWIKREELGRIRGKNASAVSILNSLLIHCYSLIISGPFFDFLSVYAGPAQILVRGFKKFTVIFTVSSEFLSMACGVPVIKQNLQISGGIHESSARIRNALYFSLSFLTFRRNLRTKIGPANQFDGLRLGY